MINSNLIIEEIMEEEYKNYIAYFIQYNGDIHEKFQSIDYGFIYEEFPTTTMILVKRGKLKQLLQEVPNIIFIEENDVYISSVMEEEYYEKHEKNEAIKSSFNGEDIIVGIVGQGVNFLDEQFQDEKGKSRIIGLWDQNFSRENDDNTVGREFYEEHINNAIKQKKEGKDPYAEVPHINFSTYVTSLCKVIGDKDSGIIPKCKYVIVRLRTEGKYHCKLGFKEEIYDTYGVLKALDYLFNFKLKENKPMVVYLPLEGRTGIKDGTSILEKAIEYYSRFRGFVIVTTTGGDGDGCGNIQGSFRGKGEVEKEFIVSSEEDYCNFNLSVSINYLDNMDIKIIEKTKNGETLISCNDWNGNYEEYSLLEGSVEVTYLPSKYTSNMKEARLRFRNVSEKVWGIKLMGKDHVNYGNFIISLERNLHNIVFTEGCVHNTLSTPSMSKGIISVMCYSKDEGGVRVISGKPCRENKKVLCPIIIDGTGTKIKIDNETIRVKGIALSGAIATALIAMLLQWAFVQGRSPALTLQDIRLYLIKASIRTQGDLEELGTYGVVDINKFIHQLM